MARFDVYPNPGSGTESTPFLLDVQSDLLDGLDSRVVVPLRNLSRFPDVKLPERLTPVLLIGSEQLLLETPKMAAVPRRVLKAAVASLAHEQARITAALDFLFQGY
jgi:toxin CcdB